MPRSGSTPFAPAVEADVLGGCLSSPNASAGWWSIVRRMSGGDPISLFYDDHSVSVAGAMEAAMENADRFTAATVADELSIRGNNDLPLSPQLYLTQLQARSNVTNIESLRKAVDSLVEKRAQRMLMTGAQRIVETIKEGEESSESIADKLRHLASDFAVHNAPLPTIGNVLDELEARESAPWYVPTGFTKLDEILLGGWEPGRLYVIGAAPKVGKSTLLLNSALAAGAEEGIHTIFASLEMHSTEIATKMMSAMTAIEMVRMRDLLTNQMPVSALDADERADFKDAKDTLRASPIEFMFVSDLEVSLSTISSRVMDLRARIGEDKPMVVFIDYLQLLLDVAENRQGHLAQITRQLKLLAGEANCPIILPSQVNRQGMTGEGMPKPHHLRDGGNIEQDADAIIMLHRNVDMGDDDDGVVVESDKLAVWVARYRNGPTGHFLTRWDGAISWVSDLTEEEEEEEAEMSSSRRSSSAPDTKESAPRRRRGGDEDSYE